MNPLYLDILTDSALAATIFPVGSEAIFYAMKSFGGHNMQIVWALATMGAVTGQLVNWYFGTLLFRLAKKNKKGISEEKYTRIQGYFKKYGVFTLLFSWVILCNLFVVMAGFLKVPLKIAMPIIAIGYGVHYAADLL